MDPLPSYGRGRELPGGRYASLIHGNGLRDVIITGELDKFMDLCSCFVLCIEVFILLLAQYEFSFQGVSDTGQESNILNKSLILLPYLQD